MGVSLAKDMRPIGAAPRICEREVVLKGEAGSEP